MSFHRNSMSTPATMSLELSGTLVLPNPSIPLMCKSFFTSYLQNSKLSPNRTLLLSHGNDPHDTERETSQNEAILIIFLIRHMLHNEDFSSAFNGTLPTTARRHHQKPAVLLFTFARKADFTVDLRHPSSSLHSRYPLNGRPPRCLCSTELHSFVTTFGTNQLKCTAAKSAQPLLKCYHPTKTRPTDRPTRFDSSPQSFEPLTPTHTRRGSHPAHTRNTDGTRLRTEHPRNLIT